LSAKQPQVVLEEKLNTYSHGLGIVLALYGLFYFINSDWIVGHSFPILVYSASLLLLFSASTWYHAVSDLKLKKRLRVLDHISIYYLIAGTYTPFCATILKDSKGTILLIIVWAMATFGTVLKLFFTGKFEIFSLVLYGVMGWLVVIDFSCLLEQATQQQLLFLALGGVFYTIGIFFYAAKKVPYNHFIWHLFVLGGAISHWFLIRSIGF